MYFTDNPDIDTLIKWWRSNQYWKIRSSEIDIQPDFLVLIAAGSLNFDTFLSNIIKHIDTIDLI